MNKMPVGQAKTLDDFINEKGLPPGEERRAEKDRPIFPHRKRTIGEGRAKNLAYAVGIKSIHDVLLADKLGYFDYAEQNIHSWAERISEILTDQMVDRNLSKQSTKKQVRVKHEEEVEGEEEEKSPVALTVRDFFVIHDTLSASADNAKFRFTAPERQETANKILELTTRMAVR